MSTHTTISQEELQEILSRVSDGDHNSTSLDEVSEVTGVSHAHLEAELRALRLEKELNQLKQEIYDLKNPPRKKGIPVACKIALWAGGATLVAIFAIVLLVALAIAI